MWPLQFERQLDYSSGLYLQHIQGVEKVKGRNAPAERIAIEPTELQTNQIGKGKGL